VSALCRETRASASTVSAALRQLQAEGLVAVVPGGGAFVKGVPPSLPDSAAAPRPRPGLARWQSLKQEMGSDILRSVYPPGSELPSGKELSARHGASHATVRQALESLARDGRVERHGRGYRVAWPTPPRSRARLVLVSPITNMGSLAKYNARSSEFWQVLQKECLRLRVGFEVRTMEQHLAAVATDREGASTLGCLVLMLGCREPHMARLPGHLLELARGGRPVAVLDDDGRFQMGPVVEALAAHPGVRFYGMGVDTTSGRAVGRYLLSHGHRRVAVFSLVDSSVWCRARAAGIEQVYAEAGLPEGVVRCTMPQYATLEAISRAATGREPYTTFQRHLEEFRASIPSVTANLIDTFFSLHTDFYLWLHFMHGEMRPLFDRTLAGRSITAWVAVSDMLAFLALGYLTDRGVRLPEELSLVGMDNLTEAFGAGLSSYDFNVPGTVRAMLDHILHYQAGARATPPVGLVEIEGQVMERRTSGPAAGEKGTAGAGK